MTTITKQKETLATLTIKYPFGFKLIWRLHFVIYVFLFFFFFFLFVQLAIVDKSTENSALQIIFFSNFFH